MEAEIAELKADRDKLQANQEQLIRAGFLAQINRCGPTKRLCVRVSEAAGAFGEEADYRVLRGY